MKQNISIALFVFLFVFLQTVVCQSETAEKNGKWIRIFNGKNLDGWTPKVTGYYAGENPLNGFRVEDGILKVDYSKFVQFNNRFGHLFYKEKLSNYILRVEYRFHGELLSDAPRYCYRNSGVMIHSQSPESMDILQNWPVSLEAQLLGSTDSIKQKTASVCTPGTYVSYKGMPSNEHCISSLSKYYNDGQWITLDIIVHGSKAIYHVINGDTILAYSDPKVGGFLLPENYPVPDGSLLEDGYIALQAEGTPIDFRKVELKILDEKPEKTAPTKILKTNFKDKKANQTFKLVDNFDTYHSNDELSKNWYQPEHGGKMTQSLDSIIRGGGKFSLRCDYETEKSDANYYVPICRVAKWDLSGCNGVKFWFKPDGSSREFTIEFNIADKNGKNIHDLWGYKYKTEKGDTASRWVSVPFFSLVHNIQYADSPDVSPTFKPEAIVEVAIYIGGRNDVTGKGTFYFDEIAGTKLQF
jgi:hypothetical protein